MHCGIKLSLFESVTFVAGSILNDLGELLVFLLDSLDVDFLTLILCLLRLEEGEASGLRSFSDSCAISLLLDSLTMLFVEVLALLLTELT